MSNRAKQSDQRDDQRQESERQRKSLDQVPDSGQQREPLQWPEVKDHQLCMK